MKKLRKWWYPGLVWVLVLGMAAVGMTSCSTMKPYDTRVMVDKHGQIIMSAREFARMQLEVERLHGRIEGILISSERGRVPSSAVGWAK